MELDLTIDLSNTKYHQWKKAEQALHDCIMWKKAISNTGYGVSWKNGKTVNAHRKVYEECNGEIPKGKVVMHLCDNKSCVNPKHLILGTYKENSEDMVQKNRQAKGELIGTSKLTPELVTMIRSMSGPSRKIAAFFGISKTQVQDIKRKKSWKHL